MSNCDHKAATQLAKLVSGTQNETTLSVAYLDLREKARDMLDFMKRAPVSSGVCCCGEEVSKHNLSSSDHCPVDMWDNAVIQYEKTLCAILGDDHE